jgi:alkyl sulfatase BDS1-like metallo-beta-lactamase superfamily hydrolase
MYGTYLESPALENCGIGPFLKQGRHDEKLGLHNLPTHTYSGDRKLISIAGVDLELVHAPGETEDQTIIYYPKHSILFAADNFYESFPNIYTLRGAPQRNPLVWADSLDLMKNLGAKVLLPSHTLPIIGEAEIRSRLEDYADAIRFVHDQTVQRMLLGQHPDEIAAELKLPKSLRSKEYLKEFYGTVAWSAKSIYDLYLGWYSGFEEDIQPLPPVEKAKRLIDLAGGDTQTILAKAEEAYNREDFQWSLELSSSILRTKKCLAHSQSVLKKASFIKVKSCTALGSRHISANARNWYLTSAMLERQDAPLIKISKEMRSQFLMQSSWYQIFPNFCLRLKAEGTPFFEGNGPLEKSICFIIHPDDSCEGTKDGKNASPSSSPEVWTLHIRNCVMYAKNEIRDDVDIIVEANESSLRSLLANPKSLATNIFSKKHQLSLKKGSVMGVIQFLSSIDRGI